MHFGEKLCNAQTGQHAIEPPSDTLGFVGFVLADRADRKSLCGNRRFGELAVRRDRIDFLKPGFEESDALGAPLIEATGNGEPQFVFALPLCEYFRRQEKIRRSEGGLSPYRPRGGGDAAARLARASLALVITSFA